MKNQRKIITLKNYIRETKGYYEKSEIFTKDGRIIVLVSDKGDVICSYPNELFKDLAIRHGWI